uniref:Uncharacterized protein n=1 Tax=Arundo donax TaxID=35708 RepID=A0A0A9DT02_ARUDO
MKTSILVTIDCTNCSLQPSFFLIKKAYHPFIFCLVKILREDIFLKKKCVSPIRLNAQMDPYSYQKLREKTYQYCSTYLMHHHSIPYS